MIETTQSLFNDRGFGKPTGLQAEVCKPDKVFYSLPPKLDEEADFTNRIAWLEKICEINTGITGDQLQREFIRLRNIIFGIPQIAKILNGVCLPVILTKCHTDDIGQDIARQLKYVDKSYTCCFPARNFYNRVELVGNVKIVPESGYNVVWKRRATEHIIALFFPNALQGFSVHAQWEWMTVLVKYGFILSGDVDPMVMYPEILAHDRNTPGLDIAALKWGSFDHSLNFRADDDRLDFDGTGSLAGAYGSYSGGLLFLE